jgi:hypothetical protein
MEVSTIDAWASIVYGDNQWWLAALKRAQQEDFSRWALGGLSVPESAPGGAPGDCNTAGQLWLQVRAVE